MSLPVYTVVSLSLALLLNQRIRGMYFFRTVLFMPSVIAGTAVAVLWSILLNPDVGVVNQVLGSLGVAHPPRWLASRDWAIPAVILMGLWGVGGGVIIYLAGLQNIPPHLYEAATIDGANASQKFRFVTSAHADAEHFFPAHYRLWSAPSRSLMSRTCWREEAARGRALSSFIFSMFMKKDFRMGALDMPRHCPGYW